MTDGEGLLFEAHDLRKSFRGEPVLSIECLKIRRGKMTAIVGASGSGKTTLLNILGGLDQPDEGSRLKVCLDDGMTPLDADGLQTQMARRASYAFQQGHLLQNATLRLNLSLASRGEAQEANFKQAILRAGLGRELYKDKALLGRRTWGLSGGQSQRLNVARAFVRDPSIVFADEPSSNLDPANGRHVIDELKGWLEERPDERSVILVTHDYELASKADDLIILHKGGLIYGGDEPSRSMPAAAIQAELERYPDDAETELFEQGAQSAPRKRGGTLASLRDAVALAWQETIAARGEKQMRFSLRRYRQWQSWVSYGLLLTLLVGLLYVYGYAEAYFEREMADPGVRHVIISGNPIFQKETQLTPDLLEELKDSPRFPNKGIFPRKNVLDFLTVELPDGRRQPFNFEILSVSPEEDAAGVIALFDVEGRPLRKNLSQALQAKDDESGRIAIAIQRDYFLAIARKLDLSPAELEQRLRLPAQGRFLAFDLVGLYDTSIADRGYKFEGIMSARSFVNLAITKGAKADLDDTDRPRFYERAAVYFDLETFEKTRTELSQTNFTFSRDNFQKLASLLGVSLQFKWLLRQLILCVGAFALFILLSNALAQMRQVWKSALILLAHGVSAYIFALSVLTQISIGLGSAAVICYGAIFLAARWLQDPVLHNACNWGLVLLGAGWATTVIVVLAGVRVMAPSRTALGGELKSN
jgi:putative ABC transport system ATP-binding protein